MIGIDFATTNSSVARASPSGEVELARFPSPGGLTDAYRSLLYLEQLTGHGGKTVRSWTGPEGIERYLLAENKGRLIQSLKSFLSSRSLQSTDVFGRRRTLEDLIARILRDLREKAGHQFGVEIRLEKAFHTAGFEAVRFELEPVAAAYHYESTLDHNELILIGDFGGGTSDFSLVHVGPAIRSLLGNAGVGLAGDAFDAKIIRRLVSPALGAGTRLRSV